MSEIPGRPPDPPPGRPAGAEEPPDYEQGLPDHHDPTAGFGGAAPAQSALTLRIVLATFGLLLCIAGGILSLAEGTLLWFPVILFVFAAIALVDLVVVVRRKLRGEPG